jgi:type IV pilus assembly protein PilE
MVEVLIVVAIIGILTAIALPGYKQHVMKANRAAAQGYMLNLASKQEQFRLNKRLYFCTSGCTNVVNLTDIATIPTEVSRNYTVTVTADDDSNPLSFLISAAPITGSSQAADTKCGTVTWTSAQVKGKSGTGTVSECW